MSVSSGPEHLLSVPLGEALRNLRQSSGMTIRKLSEITGFSEHALRHLEISSRLTGHMMNNWSRHFDRLTVLLVLSNAHQVTLSELLTCVDLGDEAHQAPRFPALDAEEFHLFFPSRQLALTSLPLGLVLRRAREHYGLSVAKFAGPQGFSPRAVQRLERTSRLDGNIFDSPIWQLDRLSVLTSIADFYNVTLSGLLCSVDMGERARIEP